MQASSPPFHGGEVGVAYAAVALSATGGVQPYTWRVSSGALPGGLALGNDGSVSGSPTAAGAFPFTIQVADAGNSIASLPGTISIAAPLSASLISGCATYCYVELGCVSVCGGFGQQNGGVGPYSYQLTQGPLPAGTSLSGLSLTGTFTGSSGWLQFTVQVTDAYGVVATVAPKFWMLDHITFAGGTLNCPYNGCAAPSTIPYQGGSGIPAARVAAWTQTCVPATCYFPPTPPVSIGGGNVIIAVPRSQGGNGYQGALTVVLSDSNLCAAGTYCSVSATVNILVAPG